MHSSPVHMALVARAASQGSNINGGSNSLSGMLSTLIPLLFVSGAYVTAFLILRTRHKRIYQPRTYVAAFPDTQKTPKPSQTTLGWIKDFWALPDEYVLNHHSLDGYLYLRFFKLIIFICFIGCLITWPVLFPVNATGDGNQSQFNILSFSNVPNQGNRYYAHTFISWIFFSFILWLIARETVLFIKLRQAYFLSPYISSRISSRTVLFTDIPKDYLDMGTLKGVFPDVATVWLVTDTKELQDLIEDRDKTAMKLEGAECKLSKDADKRRRKAKAPSNEDDAARWLDANKRPTHRLKPIIGHKVDTIDWCREHLAEIIPNIERQQEKHWNNKAENVPAAFVEFETPEAAEQAFSRKVTRMPKQIQPRAIGQKPNQIIWKNLNMSTTQRKLRKTVGTLFIILLIIFWAIPVAFVGAVSNINSLESISFLNWIGDIPPVVLGVVTGLLPTILLAVLMALVPIIIRLIAKFSGACSTGEVELYCQKWYFAFQVIQVFLVTTFTSGAAAVAKKIVSNPSSAVTLLAQSLPTASNFYINYFVLYGIALSAQTLFNVAALALYIILGKFLDTTPRKMLKRYSTIPGIKWGSSYPVYTNLAVIAITYSCIAPLVLGFATVGLTFMYIAFRYNVIYALDTTDINEQGRGYAMALQQLTTGIYLAELCMIGLFGINTSNSTAGTGPIVLMVIFLVATIIFHVIMTRRLKPYMESLTKYPFPAPTAGGHDAEALTGESRDNSVSKSTSHAQNFPAASGGAARAHGIRAWLQFMLHPAVLPPLTRELQEPHGEYSDEARKEAYLDPAVTSATPLLWIVHDGMGISAREKEDSGRVIGTSDEGAWLDGKSGSIVTVWQRDDADDDDNLARRAPVYEEPVDI